MGTAPSTASKPAAAAACEDSRLPADEDGLTTLMIAAQSGQTKELAELCAQGADVNATDWGGWNAVFWGADGGDAGLLRALCRAGADVHATTRRGTTALVWAARNDHYDAVQTLLAAGCAPG